jgi:hypothetical protein
MLTTAYLYSITYVFVKKIYSEIQRLGSQMVDYEDIEAAFLEHSEFVGLRSRHKLSP